jgi:hypothetical protein
MKPLLDGLCLKRLLYPQNFGLLCGSPPVISKKKKEFEISQLLVK